MFEISPQELVQSLPGWGYPIMLLLMILEGPIITMTAAFLASLDLFNAWAVLGLSILGDIIGDIILYIIGYTGGRPALAKARKLFKVKKSSVTKLEKRFEKSGAKIIFLVKITTGLSFVTFILAGIVRMNFARFLLYSFLGGIIWSGLLVALGYFFGFAAEQIEQYIKFAGWGIFALALLAFIYITVIKKRLTAKIFKNNKQTT